MSTQSKYCKRCDRTLPIEMFCKNKSSKDGHAFYCRDCTSKYGKEYREKNKHNPDLIYKKLKFNSINFGKKFTITLNEFKAWYLKQPLKCGYCDLPEYELKNVDDTFIKISEDRLTVDCMDNEKGYANGNLVMSCRRCNCLKSDFLSYEQMRYIGQNMIKPVWEKQLGRKLS